MFQEICEEFDFPIICHERVLPCQSQGYGFWSVFGRWNDGIVRSYSEIVFDDTSSNLDLEETWADSAQIVCFQVDKIPKELKDIIAIASKEGITIEEHGSWWDDDYKVYYQGDFVKICEGEEEYVIDEIFRKKFSLYCTWEPGLNNFFTDEFEENEIEELPEEIEVKKIRLKQS